jgi:hypothetical protein
LDYHVPLKLAKASLQKIMVYSDLCFTSGLQKLDASYLEDLKSLLRFGETIPKDVWERIVSLPFNVAVEIRNHGTYQQISRGKALKEFYDCECDNDWAYNWSKVNGFPPFMREIVYKRFEFMFYYTVNVRAELEFDIREQWMRGTKVPL